jgi:hypothetical protein
MSTVNGIKRFKKVESLRVRPVDEWSHCLVFTPEAPALITLNLDAWLIFELFGEGRSIDEVIREYHDGLHDRISLGEARDRVVSAVNFLETHRIVEKVV